MEQNEKKFEKIFDMKLLKRLNKYTKKFYLLLSLSILAVFLSTGADLLRPYLMKVVIDDYVTNYDDKMYILDNDIKDSNIILFDNEYYIRDKDYKKLEIKPNINITKQLLKNNDTFLLADEYIASNLNVDDYNLIIRSNKFTLTIKEESEIYTDKDTFYGDILTLDEYKIFRKNDINGIIKITALLISTLIVAFLFTYIQTITLNYVGQKVIFLLRKDLFDHLQHLSLSFYEKNPIGRLVTRVTNDMNNISEMYSNVIISFLKDTIILIGTMIIMVSLDWKLSLLCFSTLPIVIFVAFLFRKKIREVHRVIKIKIAKINATLSENISGMKIIQLFNQEKHISKSFDKVNKEHLNALLAEVNIYAIFRPSMNLIYSLTLSLLIFYGGNGTIKGIIELGVMVAFITYIQQYFKPIFDLSEKFNIMQSAMASIERILLLLDEDSNIPNTPKLDLKTSFDGDLEFKNVDFAYNIDEPILKNISFKVNKGETLAIVGSTGSGKTTITSLISRFYDIQNGDIYIDNNSIKDIDLQFLRSQISIVLQDVFIFAGSIKDNIALGENMTDEHIKNVATFVNANKFIENFPDKYDHVLTEKGSTLSAGQRQLLSFARALAFDPSILILDEATSNIDTETEILIQDAILKLIENRTTIIIAHRLSTIQHADKIMVMHKGEIQEIGTHQELLDKKGRYYDLYLLQYQDVPTGTFDTNK